VSGIPSCSWMWVPAKIEGEWISFAVVDTRGSYILAQNKQAPTIESLGTTIPVEGADLSVSYYSSSNILNPKVSLNYIEGGKIDAAIPVIYSNRDTLWSVIPGAAITTNGLVYQFEITDGSNKVETKYQEINVTNTKDIIFPNLLYTNIYQTFSLPMNHINEVVESLLMDEWGGEDRRIWRLYRYDSNFVELIKTSRFETGEAYWFKMKDQIPKITLEAGSSVSVPILTGTSLKLHSGWNTFSNPYLFPITLTQLQSINGGSSLTVYSYAAKKNNWSALSPDTTIDPWKGYIIWNGVEGAEDLSSLKMSGYFPNLVSTTAAVKRVVRGRGNEITVKLKGSNSFNGELTLAYNTSGAKLGRDQWDLPKPGTLNSAVSLDLKVPWSSLAYLTDRRGKLGEGQSWKITTRAVEKNEKLSLFLSSTDVMDKGIRAVLLDDARARVVELAIAPVHEYGFNSLGSGTNEFELLIGTDGYIKQRVKSFKSVIRDFKLSQNFPNPFMASTQIHYQIPSNNSEPHRKVKLVIYNLKGKVLKILVNKWQAYGSYTIHWNGRSSRGTRVPAGTYFYRLKVGNEYAGQKKLVLLR